MKSEWSHCPRSPDAQSNPMLGNFCCGYFAATMADAGAFLLPTSCLESGEKERVTL